ncbi:D-alanyl-D-alanine carboxypeptidase family protein [Tissierellaceae bacterium HCP3S3_D8]
MKKRIVSIILIVILSFTSICVYGDIDISAKSALLMDYSSGDIIYAMNEHEKLAPASITKIMTLLLTMEALDSGKIKLDDKVFISEHASKMIGTKVYLDAGETQVVNNLIKAISVRSANDAAVALAEHIAGSEEAFAKLMNQRSKELGMNNTNFVNASGLPVENHYTTAYDISIMSRELLSHEKIHEYLSIYMEDLTVGNTKTSVQTMVNTNRLIKEYDGANGIKTGFTNEAKHCISASAKRGDLQLIAVVMGAQDSKLRFTEAKRLLDYGFANYESITLGKKGDVVGSIPVEKGKLDNLEIMLERDSCILLPKGKKTGIDKKINHLEFLNAPINQGDVVGELVVSVDGKEVSKVNLVAKTSVDKANLGNIFKKTWKGFLLNR